MVSLTGFKRTTTELLGGDRGKMLIAISFGWFLSISVRMIYPALLPYLRNTYGLTLTTAGLLVTVLWVAYGLGQLPGGILADWTGERRLLIVSSLIAAGMLTLVIVANSALILFAATALFGLGTALYGVSRFTILSDIYPDQIGTATGVTMAAGDLGNAAMPPIAGLIATAVAWQYGFGFAIPLFLLAAGGLWLTLPAQPSASTPLGETFSLESVRPILRQPVAVHATGLLILWEIVLQSFLGFYPTYLVDIKDLPTHIATGFFGLFFAFGIVIKPLSGRAYDRVGVQYPLLVIVIAAAIGLGVLPFFTGFWPLVVITLLVSSLLGYETVIISNLTRSLPDDTQGTGLGILRTIYIMVGAMSPVLFGAVADRGYFDEAFIAIAVLTGSVVFITLYYIDY